MNNRTEVFNSKRLSLDINSANLNSFTLKPIHGDGNKSQICVTFNKSNVNAISFYVSYRLKGAVNWTNTPVEKVLNVINIKNVEPGDYEVRVVAVNTKQQIPSNIKQVEIQEVKTPSVTPSKNKTKVSQTVQTIASNLADDIISEVYFNLSSDERIHNKSQSSYYHNYMD